MGSSPAVKVFQTLVIIVLFKFENTSSHSESESKNNHVYRSYQTSQVCHPSRSIHHPKNVHELRDLVKEARKSGLTVKPIGSRHSTTDIICTEGLPISMSGINHSSYNEKDLTATFGAGIELEDALVFLQGYNRTLITVPSYGGITLGGAFATGSHGSSLKHPTSISDQTIRIQVMNGNGEIFQIEENAQPDEMSGFRVNLGLLGIIVEVSLKTVPLFRMEIDNELENEKGLFNGKIIHDAMNHDFYQVWWFPSLKEVIAAKGIYIVGTSSMNNEDKIRSNINTDVVPTRAYLANFLYESFNWARSNAGLSYLESHTRDWLMSRLPSVLPIYGNIDEMKGHEENSTTTGIAWRLMSSRCKHTHCWWDNPWATVHGFDVAMTFDLKEFKAVMHLIQNVAKKSPVYFYMFGIHIRFSTQSDSLLSVSKGRVSFSVEWLNPLRRWRYMDAVHGLGSYQAILQRMIQNHGARPHWGKNGLHYLGRAVLSNSTWDIASFTKLMRRLDPDGIFLNRFGRRLLNQSDEFDVDPEVTRCALHDHCVCVKDQDCGIGQKCVYFSPEEDVMVCQDNEEFSSYYYMWILVGGIIITIIMHL